MSDNMTANQLLINNEQLTIERKIDPGTGTGYYEELPDGWKPAIMPDDFVNKWGERKLGMEYIIHSWHADEFKPFMPYQVYIVNEFTTRDKLKEWAGRIYVKKG